MSHGDDAATKPVALAYHNSARTLAISPIKPTTITGKAQTVTTAIQTKRVSRAKSPPAGPTVKSASSAETANCVKAKAAARVTGSTSTATGTKTSTAPIATASAKITPIALRSQPMRTFRTPETVRRLSRHGGIWKHLLFELCFFHAPEHDL